MDVFYAPTSTTGSEQSESKKMVAPVSASWKSRYRRLSYRLQAPPDLISMEKLLHCESATQRSRHAAKLLSASLVELRNAGPVREPLAWQICLGSGAAVGVGVVSTVVLVSLTASLVVAASVVELSMAAPVELDSSSELVAEDSSAVVVDDSSEAVMDVSLKLPVEVAVSDPVVDSVVDSVTKLGSRVEVLSTLLTKLPRVVDGLGLHLAEATPTDAVSARTWWNRMLGGI